MICTGLDCYWFCLSFVTFVSFQTIRNKSFTDIFLIKSRNFVNTNHHPFLESAIRKGIITIVIIITIIMIIITIIIIIIFLIILP